MPRKRHAGGRALMAELVDALVSNTNGAIRAGSSPAQGTISRKQCFRLIVFFISFQCKIFSLSQHKIS